MSLSSEHEGEVTTVDVSGDGLKVLGGTSAVSSIPIKIPIIREIPLIREMSEKKFRFKFCAV